MTIAGMRGRRLTILAAAALVFLGAWGVSRAPAGGERGSDERLLPPGDGRFFGFNLGPIVPGRAPHTAKQYAAEARRVGANVLRNSLEWQRVERRRDVWNERRWAEYERIHRAMVARRITPLFTFGYAPKWARDRNARGRLLCTGKCPPADGRHMRKEWREFVSEAARRLPKAMFGVWNQPNLARSWSGGDLPVRPARFARLAAATDRAVGAVSASRRVLAGSLGTRPVRKRSSDMPYGEFLRRAYTAGLRGSGDAIGLNLYPRGAHLGPRSRFGQILSTVRAIKAAADDRQTPLWVTEFGSTTSGPGGATQARQAEVLLQGLRLLLSTSGIQAVLIHRLDDNPAYPWRHPEYGFGVLRAGPRTPLRPKQAYCDLADEARTDPPRCWAETRITSAPPWVHNASVATFSFRASEPDARFECSLDGFPFSPCRSPKTVAGLRNGSHRFRVRSLDSDGNRDPTPSVRVFRVDTAAPETMLLAGPRGISLDRTPTFTFASPSPDSVQFVCRLDTPSWTGCASPHTTPRLDPGPHVFAVRARDQAGNRDPAPARSRFLVRPLAALASEVPPAPPGIP